jgi:hypothetical protein
MRRVFGGVHSPHYRFLRRLFNPGLRSQSYDTRSCSPSTVAVIVPSLRSNNCAKMGSKELPKRADLVDYNYAVAGQ